MTKSKIPKYYVPALFVIAVVIITYFCPRDGQFMYTYDEGKPWRYSLLTAPFDFPIDKPKAQLEREQDSLMLTYKPYYSINKEVGDSAIAKFENFAKEHNITPGHVAYVKSKLREIYNAGILSFEDYDKIEKTPTQQLKIFNGDNIAVTHSLASFKTPKTAYQEIVKNTPEGMDAHSLASMDINNFLSDNVIYDEGISEKDKKELLIQIYPTQGMVQSGEKIIDRGEIVTQKIFDILESLKRVTKESSGTQLHKSWVIVGQVVLISLFLFSFMVYLILFRPLEYTNRKNAIFVLLMVTFFCVLTGISVSLKLFNVYIIPYVVATIMVRTFIDSRTAMITHMVMIMICSLMVPFPFEFIVLQVIAGLVCVFSLKDLAERSQLIRCAFFVLLAYSCAYIGYVFSQEGAIMFKKDVSMETTKHHWLNLLYFAVNCLFVMFTYLLIYISEKVFGFISNVSLIELSNTNKPLLQKLSEVAPGTFQHSMQVSNLSSAVAQKIGANASLVRTGALYHDIGKMTDPIFFTENQAPGINPHKDISYKESARIIINHVEEGVKIANKYGLPQQIIDFIETHHGEGKAKFFYNSYKNEHPHEDVDPKAFSYPGPNPFSKETAILMMADTVEAASRSLPEYTEESISLLVNRLIDSQIEDGLLRNAPITFKEIEKAKEIFKEKLMTIYHTRITYPELKTGDNEAK